MLCESVCLLHICEHIYTHLPDTASPEVLKRGEAFLLALFKHAELPPNACILFNFLKGMRGTFSKSTQDPHCFDVGMEPLGLRREEGREERPMYPKPEPSWFTEDNTIFKNDLSQWPHYYLSTCSFFWHSVCSLIFLAISKIQEPKILAHFWGHILLSFFNCLS